MGFTGRPGRSGTKAAMALLAMMVVVPSCGEAVDPHDDLDCRRLIGEPGNPDAIDWLKSPSARPRRIAGLSNEMSLALAYEVQRLGSVKTVVVGPAGRPLGTADEAAGLVVGLPNEPKARLGLFRLYARHVRLAGFAPRADTGQSCLYVPGVPADEPPPR